MNQNDEEVWVDVLQCEKEYNTLYYGPHYFSKRDLNDWKIKWSELISKVGTIMTKAAADVDFQDSVERVTSAHLEGEDWRKFRNDQFKTNELRQFSDFFDYEVEKNPLTTEQREAIITDEINNLVVDPLRKDFPAFSLEVHFHDTRGAGLANILAALQEGVTIFDGSIGGLGGCPYAPGASGNVATEDLVNMFEEMGIETGIDLQRLTDCAKYAMEIIDRDLPSHLLHAGKIFWKDA
jgi:hypothetical protein